MGGICYRGGYKYQLQEAHSVPLPEDLLNERLFYLDPERARRDGYLHLSRTGVLRIGAGYCWDGPSGPVRDTPSVMRAALVHDAMYQLMRRGKISPEWRPTADEWFRRLCIEGGVPRWLARVFWIGLRWFGGKSAAVESAKEVLEAP